MDRDVGEVVGADLSAQWDSASYVAGLFMLCDFIRAILFVRCFPRDTRKRLAERFLRQPDTSICDVAFLLGFSEQSAFYHAFRR